MPSEMIRIRPPTFERRFIAAETNDADTLVGLASDESYFVRRQAVQNPHTPRWILDLLVRAGATPDLRGKGKFDPDLDPDSLRRLAETGPWARQLVVEHPNTSAEVLAALKDQTSVSIRIAIAAHPNADGATLATLCCDIEAEIRARASANPSCPPELIKVLVTAAAMPDLQGVSRQFGELGGGQLSSLAEMGAWGRFLVARHPDCPADLLTTISHDPEWQVRSGLLDNPNMPVVLLQEMLEISGIEELKTIQYLSQTEIDGQTRCKLAKNVNPEVRLSVARHPTTPADILAMLATDGVKEIRQLTAIHPRIRLTDLNRLVRAGSTPDLMGLSEPDASMSAEEIRVLLDGGVWARQLAVRHPNTDAESLARLLCDREPKIREWAAVHPNLLPEIKRDLIRAGSGSDFQGFMPPDPELDLRALYQISQMGSWGEWVVANNPYAPAELLEWLAKSQDPQVRQFVARNPGTPAMVVKQLTRAVVDEVQEVDLRG